MFATRRSESLAVLALVKKCFDLYEDMVLERVIRDERRIAGETDSHGRMAGKVKIRRGFASHMLS